MARTSEKFTGMLIEAGIVTDDPNTIRKVSIVAEAGEPLKVIVEYVNGFDPRFDPIASVLPGLGELLSNEDDSIGK